MSGVAMSTDLGSKSRCPPTRDPTQYRARLGHTICLGPYYLPYVDDGRLVGPSDQYRAARIERVGA
eukprot:3898928-Rhodomonas_salina.3